RRRRYLADAGVTSPRTRKVHESVTWGSIPLTLTMFNHDNGRVLTNREVVEIAKQGGVAKCVIRDRYRKQPNGRPVVNRAWEVECICFSDYKNPASDAKTASVKIGTQGSVKVDFPINDDPFCHVVKGRGEVKLYYENHT